MKTTKLLALSLLLTFLAAGSALADDTFTRVFEQSFTPEASSMVDIVNKHGNVRVESWSQNQVKITVTLSTEASSQERADREFDKVSIALAQTGATISGKTSIQGSLQDVRIDYLVQMPKQLRLDVQNSFGDLTVGELTGKVNFDLSYGTLVADKILSDDSQPRSSISLSYSDGSRIQQANWLKLDLSYSDLDVVQSKALMIVSKYSELELQEVDMAVANSMYDEYEVGTVNKFVAESKYADFSFERVNTLLELDLSYTDLDVQVLAPTVEKVSVASKYGDIALAFGSAFAGRYDLSAEYGDLSVPQGWAAPTAVGHTGETIKGGSGAAELFIDLKYGDLQIR